ncbi:MAG: glutamate decarboxylase [Solirubrobacterales bacterium]|nr:glutamate decarboxylase [Solirubrobacterales bacterium]MBV9680582.1 glutamate decarboxylase [Solirubrobacterales bacterium]
MPEQRTQIDGGPAGGENLDLLETRYGNRFLREEAPAEKLPAVGMPAVEAMRLVGEELMIEGSPQRNLATFVTTWMEPEAQRVIAENLHRNFIDHAEYPRTAELEQRCIRMLADLFHAPGETTGARTQGSSEAIMLGALSLKWNWRKRREAARKPIDRPNLVFGGDVHVVWEKFCRYFDVEPRIVPLKPHKYTIGPEDVEPHVDENTIGVAAVLGTTFTGHADDIVGINDYLLALKRERGLDVPLHVDGASGGFVWPFLYPHSEWDFRLEQVRSINVSGHKYGLVYPGIGWLIFRERADLAEDLVFYENYLGKRDATFTLNFSTGSAMVVAQYYNFVRFGYDGYSYIMHTMQANARKLAEDIAAIGDFTIIGNEGSEQLPLVAFQLAGAQRYDEFDVASQLAAERGWMVPAYTLPPDAEHIKIMRALVKQTLGRSLATALAEDLAQACATLKEKGSLHHTDRKRVHTNTGF